VFAGGGHALENACPTPSDWAERTARLAMQFASRSRSEITFAGSAAVAEDVLRAMLLAKLRIGAGLMLLSALLVSGAALWGGRTPASVAATNPSAADVRKAKVDQAPAQENAPDVPEMASRVNKSLVAGSPSTR
jgi:hypothetical protein